ncbi:LytR/AlgR family response regulator transcription factor [Flectobacillus longus]|uniref:LytR/AlgR family response regulator transcription factor n=1 Tax=Flectobacillus longus TaxID=2984207 RepID=UPI0024B75310|nr:LytTR family DNA-binding domain-containing protein [Flectobacillus longus]MDI9882567.1 LytTR family DNA-binding domain-containing protein [Flectobacillus longus]
MSIIKSIIIDDEPKARVLLNAIVEQYCPKVQVEALCSDLPSGIKAIKKYKPDLIFLDIEMPGHSGLELLDFFDEEEVNFGIIFTTAYNEYALQAFKFSAIDYLLKPIQHTQLIEAIDRFSRKREQSQNQQLKALQGNLNVSKSWEDKRIVVPNGQNYKLLSPSDILMIKGEGSYSELYLQDGTRILASRNLKHFEEILFYIPYFFRTHKSYLVNLQTVIEFVKSDGGYLNIKGGLVAGISPEKVDEFWERLK